MFEATGQVDHVAPAGLPDVGGPGHAQRAGLLLHPSPEDRQLIHRQRGLHLRREAREDRLEFPGREQAQRLARRRLAGRFA
ncbi:MAG: hypothetical protein U0527_10585 [Candidatus Eisenbacteria bacterium]